MSQKTIKDYLFVGVQTLLFLAYALLPAFPFDLLPATLQYLGLFLAVFGAVVVLMAMFNLGASLTAYPTPRSNSTLRTQGLYSWARHPIYSGIILGALGWGTFVQNATQIIIAIALWCLFYYKSTYEEAGLVNRYGEAYRNYQKKVGRFFPKGRRQ